MKAMELKVWVDGVQRIVCGVTEFTTCQEVVIALAQAIGRTGRYTLIEKWRETERHLAPHENPVLSLNKWGQYASDVQLILQRTGPSASERPTSDGRARVPERGLYRQSLPPLAKLRPSGTDRSLKRREPKRKSLTFTGGARGLRDIFGKSRDGEAKQPQQRSVSLNLCRVGGVGGASVPGSPARELSRLVQLQRDKLQALESRLLGCEAEMQDWDDSTGKVDQGGNLEDEVLLLEQLVRRNDKEMEEEEFWHNELLIEQESEQQLRVKLAELQGCVRDCEAKLEQYLARIERMEAGVEQEQLQQEAELNQEVNEEEVESQMEKVKAELEVQSQHTARLESSCRALERSLGQSGKRLQEKEQELEQLTKELRQVNLQQFIQQTGTKVTVLPAQPATEIYADTESLKRLGSSRLLPSNPRSLQGSLNPEGIYV
ncbi:ras association domain-containing protein 8b isoform X1 [Takifugu rubripes]|uniref:Ras association domain family member 8b n=2 Tax=Takifugu TaxID=31032 RepID=H2UZH7_TAKRU|nr:ras association domain-containing protein 8-like isoform X1 [Takifugu rubripes]XP_029681572.1 ras association domain-containing protein 8-like isoform X1 [Takifugu rubripes]XP_029681573.1 ras association domain-containing protein 8-like isoform X1 [Takifugu rubripes]XP_029681574.1 ras association domain-containing protein 8-like isoform X1 [Takifugu rubripes]XP_029681575.1 ras association domain-containing protein 8-like isoform X1 [Takifugu rubripes]|eukprot:XP_011611702.1 PREDICTED: ras association domain-containing protein 8-like isoform X1 [Takifugu rubripes]